MSKPHAPHHYDHPSGVTCMDVVRDASFLRGNCIKYIWRAGEKEELLEDLAKANEYLTLLTSYPDDKFLDERSEMLKELVARYVEFEADKRRARLIENLALRPVGQLVALGISRTLKDWIADAKAP
ncbi:MAG: DUF3310 domain-containing protein [Pseudomonadota bacterium]